MNWLNATRFTIIAGGLLALLVVVSVMPIEAPSTNRVVTAKPTKLSARHSSPSLPTADHDVSRAKATKPAEIVAVSNQEDLPNSTTVHEVARKLISPAGRVELNRSNPPIVSPGFANGRLTMTELQRSDVGENVRTNTQTTTSAKIVDETVETDSPAVIHEPITRSDEIELPESTPRRVARTQETLPTPRGNPSPNSRDAVPHSATPPSASSSPADLSPAIPSANDQAPIAPAGPELSLLNENAISLPAQPKLGDHFPQPPPELGCLGVLLDSAPGEFTPDPISDTGFDPNEQLAPYDGKKLNCTQMPMMLWGRPFYSYGLYKPANNVLGGANVLTPRFMIFGDVRSCAATNNDGKNGFTALAKRINLDADLQITATERLHAAVQPLNKGTSTTRVQFDNPTVFIDETNFNLLTGYLEGDLGALVGGLTGNVLPFDLPFAIGAMPLLFQNGVWLDDNFVGVAATIPARNSPLLRISNMDTTFFYAWDGITSPAFPGDSGAAELYGVHTFIEAWEGYLEVGYAYLEDRGVNHRSYHNIGASWTRRYGHFISNSFRVIGNLGQEPRRIGKTADGAILMFESSLISGMPWTFVPYFNAWTGFGNPQSVARNANAGGVLTHTGILFETDGMTNYPTLNNTGSNNYGAALGLNLLPASLSQQFVIEAAMVEPKTTLPLRGVVGEQFGIGFRYQRVLNKSMILRTDGMYGFQTGLNDLTGLRVELRHKF